MSNIIDKLNEHIKIQDELNCFLVKEDWHNHITPFQIKMAIISECGELVDSLNYKWWTKSELDEDNLKIEVIDIWHFLLTYYLYYVKHGLINKNDDILISNVINGYEDVKRWLSRPNYNYIPDDILKMFRYMNDMITRDPNLMSFYYFGYLIFDVNMDLDKFDEMYKLKVKLNKERKIKGYDKNPNVKYIDGIEDNKNLIKEVNKNE